MSEYKREIWKFPLKSSTEQFVTVPKGYQIVSLQVQNGVPCIWAIVNPGGFKYNIRIRTYCTGEEFDMNKWEEEVDFIGTYQLGILVFHVFGIKRDF